LARRSGARNTVDIHVGDRLRLRRKCLGVSQDRLAATVSITAAHLDDYERGAHRISAAKLLDISRVLKVPVAYFFEGVGDPMSPETPQYRRTWSETLEELLATAHGERLGIIFLEVRRRSADTGAAEVEVDAAAHEEDAPASPPVVPARPTRH